MPPLGKARCRNTPASRATTTTAIAIHCRRAVGDRLGWPSSSPARSERSTAKASGEKPSAATTATENASRRPRCSASSASATQAAPAVNGYDPDTIETNGVVHANAMAGLRAALPHSRRQTVCEAGGQHRGRDDEHRQLARVRGQRVVEDAVAHELVPAGVPQVVPELEAAVAVEPGLEEVRRSVAGGRREGHEGDDEQCGCDGTADEREKRLAPDISAEDRHAGEYRV